MIHPDIELRIVSPEIGYGVFATAFIPKGTITYIKDPLEIEITPEAYQNMPEGLQKAVDRFSYKDEKGVRVVSWDHAKYVNHCCQCNTMSTGYGFEIAIRDIYPGEQITDEYGIFNIDHDISLICDRPGCRKVVSHTDFDQYFQEWDQTIRQSLTAFTEVEQPLLYLMEPVLRTELEGYLEGRREYRSVYELKHAVNV